MTEAKETYEKSPSFKKDFGSFSMNARMVRMPQTVSTELETKCKFLPEKVSNRTFSSQQIKFSDVTIAAKCFS
jgi:hypothetical protein